MQYERRHVILRSVAVILILTFALWFVPAAGITASAGPLTVTGRAELHGSRWEESDVIDLIALAPVDDATAVHLGLRAVAVPIGWFGTAWQFELYSSTGILPAGETLPLPGMERVRLNEGDTFESTLAYDPATGEISVSVKADGDEPAYAGYLYGHPAAGTAAAAAAAGENAGVRYGEPAEHRGYERLGSAYVFHNASVVAAGADPGAGEARFLFNDDALRFLIRRQPGQLSGTYRLELVHTGSVLAQVPAAEELTEINVARSTLPADRYEGVLYYVEDDYIEEVGRTAWRVVGPTVQIGLDVAGQLARLAFLRPSALQGELKLTPNQTVPDVSVTLATGAGDEILHRTLATMQHDTVTLPFRVTPERGLPLQQMELIVTVKSGDEIIAARQFSPFGVLPEMAAALDVQTETVSFFGEERLEEAVQDDSVFRIWLVSRVDAGELDDLAATVRFVSPSGKEITMPARRITLPPGRDPLAQHISVKMTGTPTASRRPNFQHHWFADIKPGESGVWQYSVEIMNSKPRLEHFDPDPNQHPVRKYWRWTDVIDDAGRVEIASGSFNVAPAPVVSAEKADTNPVAKLTYIQGSTVKLEQVTGDWDKHFYRPTLSQTLSRYAVGGTDLGRTFEHDGKLILLFGDTVGPEGFIESFVAVSDTKDPEAEGGVRMDIFTDRFGRTLRLQPPGISMGGFEVPTGGISLDGKMYILVRTSFNDPYGRSVLLHFDDERAVFRVIREFSPFGGKFTEVEMRLSPEPIPGLPADEEYVLLWGTGEKYRRSPLYLAVIPASRIEENGATLYFTGLDDNGDPLWGTSEDDAVPVIRNVFVGEFSVIRIPELDIWAFMYADLLFWATEPWGPWSRGIAMPNEPVAADSFQYRRRSDPYLAGPVIGPEDPYREGGPYGHYMVERFTQLHDDVLRLYYMISTWNPYEVVLMRSDFRVERAAP